VGQRKEADEEKSRFLTGSRYKMTMDEINAEIAAYRRERRAKGEIRL
jgi:hypothetical protein